MSSTLIPPFVFLLLALTSRLYEIALLDSLFTALAANSPGWLLALFVALGCPLLAILQGTRLANQGPEPPARRILHRLWRRPAHRQSLHSLHLRATHCPHTPRSTPCSVFVRCYGHCGCNTTPDTPAANTFKWERLTRPELGYALDYPYICVLDKSNSGPVGTMFRWDGTPIIVVNYVDEQEGHKRGLWVRHQPGREIKLGKKSVKYVYDHCDGPFCMQTVSYVVEHRQRYLGLEFRTANAELAPVYRQVVDSFAFN